MFHGHFPTNHDHHLLPVYSFISLHWLKTKSSLLFLISKNIYLYIKLGSLSIQYLQFTWAVVLSKSHKNNSIQLVIINTNYNTNISFVNSMSYLLMWNMSHWKNIPLQLITTKQECWTSHFFLQTLSHYLARANEWICQHNLSQILFQINPLTNASIML